MKKHEEILMVNKMCAHPELIRDMTREHRLMFGALAKIKDALPAHFGEGDDYLTQLLEFRRKADEALKLAWQQMGLS
jgi:hypothetical protein